LLILSRAQAQGCVLIVYYFEERILSVCATSLLLESSLVDKSNEIMMMMIELGDTKIKVKD
jgi:hypothetical protein